MRRFFRDVQAKFQYILAVEAAATGNLIHFHVMPDRFLMGVPVTQKNSIQQSVRSFKSLWS